MLTEVGVLRTGLVGGELKDIDKYKKGVIRIESPDGLLFYLCFPVAKAGRYTYAKRFLVSDLLSERVEQERRSIPLASDTLIREYPLDKILRSIGATVRIEGNFCIYTVAREFLDYFDPKRIARNKSKVDLSNENRPFYLIDGEEIARAYWDGKKFNDLGLGYRKLHIISTPIEIV